MSPMIFEQIVQYGFAGLAAAELVVLVWLTQRLLRVLEQTSRLLEGNTGALRALAERQRELSRQNGEIRDRLLARPCLRNL